MASHVSPLPLPPPRLLPFPRLKFNPPTHCVQVAIHFWAGWCEPCALLDQVLEQLAHDAPSVTCARVEAEEVSDVSELVGVSVVPLLVFYSGGKEVNRVEGADPAALTTTFMSLANAPTAVGNGHGAVANGTPASASAPASAEPPTTSASSQRIESLVKQRPIMLFMKGSPGAPRCGFSRRVVEALENALGGTLHPSTFGYFDILTDDGVREGLKQYSQWPTYPQLYVNGELVGGCDIVLEMAETGDLAAELSKVSISADRDATREDPKAALEARLKELVKRQDVMLFMKGTSRGCLFVLFLLEKYRHMMIIWVAR